MKVFLVIMNDWDTEGHTWFTFAGVFSSMEKIPDRLKGHSDVEIKEITLDEIGSW
jgi:hypothetical protein